MEKEHGYDEWFIAKVMDSLEAVKTGATPLTEHNLAMDRVWDRVQARVQVLRQGKVDG